MGLFSPKVPNTISDKKMKDLQRRGSWANRKEDIFSKKAVNRRLASQANARKSWWN